MSQPPQPVQSVSWAQTALIFFLATCVFNLLAAAFTSLSPAFSASAWGIRLAMLLNSIILFLLPALILCRRMGEPLMFRTPSSLRQRTAWGIYAALVAAASFAPADFLAWANSLLMRQAEGTWLAEWASARQAGLEAAISTVLSAPSPQGYAANVVALCLMPAVCEEFFFRKFLQKRMRLDMPSPTWAILATAFIFSAMHLELSGFLPRLFWGVVLGVAYHTSNRLSVPILIHAANNFVAMHIQENTPITFGHSPMPYVATGASLAALIATHVLFRRIGKRKRT